MLFIRFISLSADKPNTGSIAWLIFYYNELSHTQTQVEMTSVFCPLGSEMSCACLLEINKKAHARLIIKQQFFFSIQKDQLQIVWCVNNANKTVIFLFSFKNIS